VGGRISAYRASGLFPRVVYAFQGGNTESLPSDDPVASRLAYQVVAMDAGASMLPLGPAAGRLRALLHGWVWDDETARYSCRLMAPLSMPMTFTLEGKIVSASILGGLYRFTVQPKS
jgi:hypothetical protein